MLVCRFHAFCRLACRRIHGSNMALTQPQTENPNEKSWQLKFDNKVLRSLPVDTSRVPGSRQVAGACFSLVTPTPVASPSVVAVSPSALGLLGLDEQCIENKDFAEYFSGNKIFPGSEPASHCYCGHQFGYFSGQLGDGAAMYLGEVINGANERWEVQLKGSGLTPYSRTADGRKVLRSSIREFLCSEAIHNLGIPTTRAGSCVTSKTRVIRDIFYDGNPKSEQCTIVSRIAQTFLRFGSFEIFKPTDDETGRAGPSVGKHDILRQMLDYACDTFFPELKVSFPDKQEIYTEFYREVCKKTAALVAEWQCVGFCHGVLNTDNMSILGLTIDYGPFGFMERFDPNFICNGSDDGGRYAYKNQPDICKWNLQKFAEAIKEAVPLSKTLPVLDQEYQKEYDERYMTIMRKKLGLIKVAHENDSQLVKELLNTMEATSADFTNCFRELSNLEFIGMKENAANKEKTLQTILSTCLSLEEMKTLCKPKMDPQQLQVILAMARENPGLLQMLTGGRMGMIRTELDNMEKMERLGNMNEEQLKEANRKKWMDWLNMYEKRLAKEVADGSDLKDAYKKRSELMNSINPRFILRNYIAQNAIEEAENGNYEEVRKVLKLLEHPYDDDVNLSEFQDSRDSGESSTSHSQPSASALSCKRPYATSKTPLWALQLKVT